MITKPSATAKDQRIVFTDHRVEHKGIVWTINAKFNPENAVLKVYRIEGDVTQMPLFHEAMNNIIAKETNGEFTLSKIKS